MPETKLGEVEGANEAVDRPNRIVRTDIVLDPGRKQTGLLAAFAALERAIRHGTNRTRSSRKCSPFLPSLVGQISRANSMSLMRSGAEILFRQGSLGRAKGATAPCPPSIDSPVPNGGHVARSARLCPPYRFLGLTVSSMRKTYTAAVLKSYSRHRSNYEVYSQGERLSCRRYATELRDGAATILARQKCRAGSEQQEMQTIGLIGGMSWESTAVYYRRHN